MKLNNRQKNILQELEQKNKELSKKLEETFLKSVIVAIKGDSVYDKIATITVRTPDNKYIELSPDGWDTLYIEWETIN